MCDGVLLPFCHTSLAELIAGELIKVRHTTVACSICRPEDFIYQPKVKEIMGHGCLHSSGCSDVGCISVFPQQPSVSDRWRHGVCKRKADYDECVYPKKQGDLISARGEGKFRYVGAEKETKRRVWILSRFPVNKYVSRGQKGKTRKTRKQENNYGKDNSKQTYSKDRGEIHLMISA